MLHNRQRFMLQHRLTEELFFRTMAIHMQMRQRIFQENDSTSARITSFIVNLFLKKFYRSFYKRFVKIKQKILIFFAELAKFVSNYCGNCSSRFLNCSLIGKGIWAGNLTEMKICLRFFLFIILPKVCLTVEMNVHISPHSIVMFHR